MNSGIEVVIMLKAAYTPLATSKDEGHGDPVQQLPVALLKSGTTYKEKKAKPSVSWTRVRGLLSLSIFLLVLYHMLGTNILKC